MSIRRGTIGIGQEKERKEGNREETKSESEGKEGVLGATNGEVTKGRLGDSDWENQVDKDEEKGIWGLVRWESWAKGKKVSLNRTWQAI